MPRKLMTYRLEEEISKQFKVYAAENGTTMQDIIEKYVIKLLAKNKISK